MSQIGVPVYSQSKRKTFKVKDGSNIFRLLPPFKSFASDGKWAKYEAIHWGYKGSNGTRTFRCIREKDLKTKMLKVRCPECDLIEERKLQFDSKVEELQTKGDSNGKKYTKDQALEFLKPFGDWLFAHNRDSKWYINALNNNNEIGRLAIPHKMYVILQGKISELLKEGVDPLRVDQGVQLDFYREGSGGGTVHKVEVVQETVEYAGKKLKTAKAAPLTPDVLERMDSEAWDLVNMFHTLTQDQIQLLVSSEGDTQIVDSLFSTPKTERVNETDEDEPNPGEEAATVTTSPVNTTLIVTKLEPDKEKEIVKLKAQLAKLQAGPVVVVPPPTNVPTTGTVVPTAKTMSTADFLAAFGNK